MKTTLEQKKRQYQAIYKLLFGTPRIYKKDIWALLELNDRTVAKRMREALQDQYIIGPDIRKRSYSNLREYMYFVNFVNPELDFLRYRKDPRVTYHAKTIGFANIWIIAREKIDVDGDIIFEGPRSDYHTSYAPHHSWVRALEIMRKMIEEFDPGDYILKKYIQTHFDEFIEWDEKYELLYKYFKYDLRKPFAPVMRKGVSGSKLYKFLEKLPETCTIATSYYPESLSAYESYFYMFETDYEDFLIDLFSELPTTASFFKVSDKLFAQVYIPEKLAKNTELQLSKKLYIPLLMVDLLKKGIIKSKEYSIIEYSKGKSL